MFGLMAAGLWMEEHPAGPPVDLHHQVWREMMKLVRIDGLRIQGFAQERVDP